MTDERVEAILDQIRTTGGRVTAPRRAIVAELVSEDRHHRTADELTEAVRSVHPDVHASTVYRTLDTLEELGIATHLHVGAGAVVYHLAGEVHTHLVCQGCGRVISVPPSTFADARNRVATEHGFDLDPTHYAVAGHCADCQAR